MMMIGLNGLAVVLASLLAGCLGSGIPQSRLGSSSYTSPGACSGASRCSSRWPCIEVVSMPRRILTSACLALLLSSMAAQADLIEVDLISPSGAFITRDVDLEEVSNENE